MVRFLCIILLILVASTWVAAQKINDSATVVEADGNSCEINSLQIDVLGSTASNTGERIYVIARAGRAETEAVNLRRLQKLRQFLERLKGFTNLDVIYARRERVSGEGQIEFYAGSSLRLIIKAKLNRSPCMDCCGGGYLSSPTSLLGKSKKKRPKSKF